MQRIIYIISGTRGVDRSDTKSGIGIVDINNYFDENDTTSKTERFDGILTNKNIKKRRDT